MTDFICSFSASRLKGFRLPFALSLSLDLLFEELPKNELDIDEDLAWLTSGGCG